MRRIWVLSALLFIAATPARSQTPVSADLGFQPESTLVSPNPALPGSTVSYQIFVQNFGPSRSSYAPVVVTATFPPEVTLNGCSAALTLNGGVVLSMESCVVNGSTVTATYNESLQTLDPAYDRPWLDRLFIFATLSPAAPAPGGQFSATFTVSAPSQDPNPANNSVTIVLSTPSPIVVTGAPIQLDFGVATLGYQFPPLEVQVTNAGKTPIIFVSSLDAGGSTGSGQGSNFVFVQGPTVTGPFAVSDTECTGPPGTSADGPGIWYLMPGATCSVDVYFTPVGLGPASGTMTFYEFESIPGSPSLVAQQVVSLKGVGANVGVLPRNLTFPLTQDASTSPAQALSLFNTGPADVTVASVIASGKFSATNDCGGVVTAQGACDIFVSFSPTISGTATGSVSITEGDIGSPLQVPLSGLGTAVKLSRDPENPLVFENDVEQVSKPQQIVLTDASTQPLKLGQITATGDFFERDDCPRGLHSGQSCTISVFYKPSQDGGGKGTLTIVDQDAASPETFQLVGTGVGADRGVIFLHYDYTVGSDHTHDPEVVAPGALREVRRAFARHGILLVIDPEHAAIPETTPDPSVPPYFYFPTIIFGTGTCGGAPGGANFYDLKTQYYTGKNPRTHYMIFGHEIADSRPGDSFDCAPGFYSGLAELPGQNFVIALGDLDLRSEVSASLERLFVGSSFMHELGHNLGLHHGGGIGAIEADDTNDKPSYLSIMNYNFLFNGISVADHPGSTQPRSCSQNSDCPGGALCVNTAVPPTGPPANACIRLDYSRQVLPTGGNTPGALDERNLNEPAGLGSGNSDIFIYPNKACDNVEVAASNGPVDWDNDGTATSTHTQANVLMDNIDLACSSPLKSLAGFDDWKALTQNLDATGMPNPGGTNPPAGAPEVDLNTLRQKHLFYPLLPAHLVVHPGCPLGAAPIAPERTGTLTVAIPGTATMDVTRIDLSSLRLHGLKPESTVISDANGDGRPDVVMTFDQAELHIRPQTKEIHVSGFLNHGQRFVAAARVAIVNDMSSQPPNCRN
ncbi:MAG TPA: choice-of-anchor D domain-containing protein [Candidatus Acidoferrales bacterium]|nr:choice-of-anchor D domain-containing protein [Candidatus Acidoferrales bacterium]